MKSILTILFLISAAYLPCHALELTGKLIVSAGGIKILDLKTKKAYEVLENNAEDLSIYANNVMFTEEGCIKSFNLKTMQVSEVTKGVKPYFNEQYSKLLYYDKIGSETWLCSKIGEKINKINLAPMPFTKWTKSFEMFGERIETSPIPVSNNIVVFVGNNRNLWMYNVTSEEVKDTGISNCIPRVFRTNKNQLLCESFSDRIYYLVPISANSFDKLPLSSYEKNGLFIKGIDGNALKIEILPIPKHSASFVYIQKNDALIYGTAKGSLIPFGERYPIMAYDFSKKKTQEILPSFSYESAVWVDSAK